MKFHYICACTCTCLCKCAHRCPQTVIREICLRTNVKPHHQCIRDRNSSMSGIFHFTWGQRGKILELCLLLFSSKTESGFICESGTAGPMKKNPLAPFWEVYYSAFGAWHMLGTKSQDILLCGYFYGMCLSNECIHCISNVLNSPWITASPCILFICSR